MSDMSLTAASAAAGSLSAAAAREALAITALKSAEREQAAILELFGSDGSGSHGAGPPPNSGRGQMVDVLA